MCFRATHRYPHSLPVRHPGWNLHVYPLGLGGSATPTTPSAGCGYHLALPVTVTACRLHVKQASVYHLLHRTSKLFSKSLDISVKVWILVIILSPPLLCLCSMGRSVPLSQARLQSLDISHRWPGASVPPASYSLSLPP